MKSRGGIGVTAAVVPTVLRAAFLVCLWVGTLPPVLAWNDAGHMLAARSAYQTLTVAERDGWRKILAEHPRFEMDFVARIPKGIVGPARDEWLFAQASTWPDLARHFGHVKDRRSREKLVEQYGRGPWHYVNVVLEVDDSGQIRDVDSIRWVRGRPTHGPADILEALAQLRTDWSSAVPPDRAIALCWLLHLVADLQQPLHTTALFAPGSLVEGDRGGNQVRVRGRRGTPGNLHALWDAGAGRSRSWEALDRQLAGLSQTPQARPASPLEPIDFRAWALEGSAIARESVYTEALRDKIARASARQDVPRVTPDAAYLDSVQRISRERIGLAAQRTVQVLRALDD